MKTLFILPILLKPKKQEKKKFLNKKEEEIEKVLQVQRFRKKCLFNLFPIKSPFYTAADFMLEKQQDHYVLWIKARKSVGSLSMLLVKGFIIYVLLLLEEQKK